MDCATDLIAEPSLGIGRLTPAMKQRLRAAWARQEIKRLPRPVTLSVIGTTIRIEETDHA